MSDWWSFIDDYHKHANHFDPFSETNMNIQKKHWLLFTDYCYTHANHINTFSDKLYGTVILYVTTHTSTITTRKSIVLIRFLTTEPPPKKTTTMNRTIIMCMTTHALTITTHKSIVSPIFLSIGPPHTKRDGYGTINSIHAAHTLTIIIIDITIIWTLFGHFRVSFSFFVNACVCNTHIKLILTLFFDNGYGTSLLMGRYE